ncbi:sulfatase-like hydrolase/transferase [Bacteroidota bacterium]
MRNHFIILIVLAGLVSCTTQKEAEKPNIIFLFADDQCYNTLGAYGHPEVKTPNLDELAQSGTIFTHAYNMGAWNGAVCQASRAMMNTGRSVWRAYEIEDRQSENAERGELWSQLMSQAGYKTYMTGKWHVATPAGEIFDNVVHVRPGMPKDHFVHADHWRKYEDSVLTGLLEPADIMPHGYWRPTSPQDSSWLPWDKSEGGFWEGGTHWSEVLAEDAIGFISEAGESDEPFFMYLAFNASHDPRQSPREYVEMYPLEELSIPENFAPEYPYDDSIGNSPRLRDAALAPFPRTEYAVKVHKQEYYAIISHMDAQIGKIIEALKASGKMDNTYIFYTADHGLAVGEHGLFGKQTMYDHSVRAPLFVLGPDVPKNKKQDVDVYIQDIMASSLELAGIEKPEYVEFSSLMPFLTGEQTESNYDAIYGCYLPDLQRMVRKDGFKLILYPHGKTVRLYDVASDPLESNDLAANPEYSEKISALYQDLLKLQDKMDDPLDLRTVFGEKL